MGSRSAEEDAKDVLDLRGFAGIGGFGEVGARSRRSGVDADLLGLSSFSVARLDAGDVRLA